MSLETDAGQLTCCKSSVAWFDCFTNVVTLLVHDVLRQRLRGGLEVRQQRAARAVDRLDDRLEVGGIDTRPRRGGRGVAGRRRGRVGFGPGLVGGGRAQRAEDADHEQRHDHGADQQEREAVEAAAGAGRVLPEVAPLGPAGIAALIPDGADAVDERRRTRGWRQSRTALRTRREGLRLGRERLHSRIVLGQTPLAGRGDHLLHHIFNGVVDRGAIGLERWRRRSRRTTDRAGETVRQPAATDRPRSRGRAEESGNRATKRVGGGPQPHDPRPICERGPHRGDLDRRRRGRDHRGSRRRASASSKTSASTRWTASMPSWRSRSAADRPTAASSSVVVVEEGAAERGRDPAPDRRLSRTHRPHEHHVARRHPVSDAPRRRRPW